MRRLRLLIKAETTLEGDAIDELVERLNKHLEAEGLEEIVIATTDNDAPQELWTQKTKLPSP